MKFPRLCLFAALLGSTALARADYSHQEPFSRQAPFSATGEVSLENVNGDVTVRGWDKDEIRIEGGKSAQTAEELKPIDLRIELSASRAVVKVHLPKRPGGWFGGNTIRASVRFTVTVPATAILQHIEGVNSTITLEGLHGSAKADSVNGAIVAHGLAGDARLKTVNGSINAEFDRVGPQQKLSFETVNGGIAVRLPKDAGVTLHGQVVNGHIDCAFPLTLGHTSHGRTLSGTIGDGRASLEAQSVNGGIRIESL